MGVDVSTAMMVARGAEEPTGLGVRQHPVMGGPAPGSGAMLTTLEQMANEVIHMSLEEFQRGFTAPPAQDGVSITVDGRRLDSKSAVLAWWADVSDEIDGEEADNHAAPGA